MNIKVCDVCKKDEKKLVEAEYRIGWRNSIKIDTCKKHSNFIKGKTPKEVRIWYYGFDTEAEKWK